MRVRALIDHQDALNHVKAIHMLCASDPSLIDTGKAAVLLSYLRSPVKNVSHIKWTFLTIAR